MANIREAARRLGDLSTTQHTRLSPLYESQPVGPVSQPWFINAVLALDTKLPPRELLVACKRIEAELGRVPSERWGPRLIDLDLLLYGEERVSTHDLVVPHAALRTRRFVLMPLLDVLTAGPEADDLRQSLSLLPLSDEVHKLRPEGAKQAQSVVRAIEDRL
jgi:2-amino-4-hydroxy-6-hydroxymethyldihydropteridine diphosphokinase